MNKFYCISIFILLFLSSCVNAQSTEKYQISIMKFTKTLEGVNLPVKEVLVDSMGYVRNNQNKDIIKINLDSLKQDIQSQIALYFPNVFVLTEKLLPFL